LREKWPEIGILSQSQVMAEPLVLRRAFDAASHTAVIVEGSPVALSSNDLQTIQRRKRVKLPLLYNQHSFDGVFSEEVFVLSFDPFGFKNETSAERVQKVIEAASAGAIKKNDSVSPGILHVIAADAVALNRLWDAAEIEIKIGIHALTPHFDKEEAFAVRTIAPPNETIVLCKSEDHAAWENIHVHSSRQHDGSHFVHAPSGSLTLVKGQNWGACWDPLKPTSDLGRGREVTWQGQYHHGQAHVSARTNDAGPAITHDRVIIKYSMNSNLVARERMQSMPLRPISDAAVASYPSAAA